jgi:hypothetical protein
MKFFVAQVRVLSRPGEIRLEAAGTAEVLRGAGRARLGEDRAKGLADPNGGKAAGKAAVSLRRGDFVVDLYPFVFLSGGDIFFFDSFLYRKGKSCVISYPPGFRRNEDLDEVAELARTVDLATAMASVQGGFGGATYLSENDSVIQSLFEVEDFRRPDHLVDWLSSALKAHPKGDLFHLPWRWHGKSYFARALARRVRKRPCEPLKNATVRGYISTLHNLSTRRKSILQRTTDIFKQDEGRIAPVPIERCRAAAP